MIRKQADSLEGSGHSCGLCKSRRTPGSPHQSTLKAFGCPLSKKGMQPAESFLRSTYCQWQRRAG
eukprot:11204690-Lingulodinium_polyedra.AAC.1